MDGLVYLASPYNDPDPEVRERRFLAVNHAASWLMRQGKHVFSPISHGHPIALAGDLPKGWDYWGANARLMLAACEKVIVLMQDGWRESEGVQAEIAIAKELGLPIEYMRADDCTLDPDVAA